MLIFASEVVEKVPFPEESIDKLFIVAWSELPFSLLLKVDQVPF